MSHVAVAVPTRKSDAAERALRTLWQGFGVDALVLIGLGIAALMSEGIDPTTPTFWIGLGALVIKSILTAFASYLVRLKIDPTTDDTVYA